MKRHCELHGLEFATVADRCWRLWPPNVHNNQHPWFWWARDRPEDARLPWRHLAPDLIRGALRPALADFHNGTRARPWEHRLPHAFDGPGAASRSRDEASATASSVNTPGLIAATADMAPAVTISRPSMVDPYLPSIHETLDKYPKLRASRYRAPATVREAFAEKAQRLLPLPATAFPCDEQTPVSVGTSWSVGRCSAPEKRRCSAPASMAPAAAGAGQLEPRGAVCSSNHPLPPRLSSTGRSATGGPSGSARCGPRWARSGRLDMGRITGRRATPRPRTRAPPRPP